MNWKQAFDQELQNAIKARGQGKEAMARVCARRAANIVSQQYLRSRNISPSGNAMQNFRRLQNDLPADHPAQKVLAHLVLKVNEDFTFPSQLDLIEDAQLLLTLLLEE